MGRTKRQRDPGVPRQKAKVSPPRNSRRVIAVVLLGVVLGAGIWAFLRNPRSRPQGPPAGGIAGSDRAGKVELGTPRFSDFVGSEACASCHTKEFDLWKNSTHGNAGGLPGEAQVIARFDGQPLRFADAVVTPTTNRAGDYLFLIDEPGESRREIRVDAVIGGGHMHGGGTQSFFQKQPDGTYRFLPFDFIKRENLWFVQLRRDMTWVPVTADLALNGDLANWPPRRVLGTASEFSNCQNCHGSQITLNYDQDARAYETRFQTLRINCESCHGAGRRHIELVSRPGWDKDPDIGMKALATATKQESMETCHQCHATKDAIRDEPFLPGHRLEDYFSLKLGFLTETPFLADGRVSAFGYQSNHEFSDCYLNGSMTCTDCHDPHSQGYRDVFGKPLTGRFDNRQCTGCHASKGLTAEAHSHHAGGSSGNQCVACHMPYLQHRGVGRHLAFARSDHSIPIPRPGFDHGLGIENACQKCHQDKDLAWQQAKVDEWYGSIKPHPPLVVNLARTDGPAGVAEAARLFLDPSARHPMAQAAGLGRFIERYLQPDATPVEADVLARLKALADDSDADLRAMALAALHIGFGHHDETKRFLEGRLSSLPAMDPVRRRWAVAVDQAGGVRGAKGDLSGAIACFGKSLEIDPLNEVTLSHLALAHLRAGDVDTAIVRLRKAIEIRPTKAALHFQLAQIYAQLQRLPEAVAAMEAGLQFAPNDAAAVALLRQLRGL